jgi:hypothetical protein
LNLTDASSGNNFRLIVSQPAICDIYRSPARPGHAAAQPGTVLQTAQTTSASNTFAGLTPGVTYNVEANAVGAAGPSDWSDSVSQMAV